MAGRKQPRDRQPPCSPQLSSGDAAGDASTEAHPHPVAPNRTRFTLLEGVTVLVLMACGFGLRAVHFEHIAVEHFDEGVYSANWYCRPPGLPSLTFPQQQLYAPPLFPELLRWVLFFSGGALANVGWVNVLAGTLLIPLVWWIARDWQGRAAGLGAAALAAFSDPHIVFSRTVLTDVLLTLFLTAGVWTGVRAVLTGRPVWIVLAGVLAAAAWWTKYNGWLTLAITGGGLVSSLLLGRRPETSPAVLIGRWLATAVIAFALWSPVLQGLQETGGYAAVAANHARYVVGLRGWFASAVQQWERLQWLESGYGWLAAVILLGVLPWAACGTFASAKEASHDVPWLLRFACTLLPVVGGGLFALGWWGTSQAAVPAWVALKHKLTRRSPAPLPAPPERPELPDWTLTAWVLGLTALVPLYTPYPRLALPLVAGWWLAAARLWGTATSPATTHTRDASGLPDLSASDNGRRLAACMVVGWLLLGCLWSTRIGPLFARPDIAWQDRRGLKRLCGPIATAATQDLEQAPAPGRSGVTAVFYVFAEPALFVQLSARRGPLSEKRLPYFVQPVGDHGLLDSGPPDAAVATFLLTGLHATENAADVAAFQRAAARGRLRLIAEFPYHPSDVVLLDRTGPGGLGPLRNQTVRLYRVP